MNAMKKILALALAGVMALALLTGCGTGGSASHKSIAKAMADCDNGLDGKTTITCTSSAELDAKLQQLAANPKFKTIVKKVYNNEKLSSDDIPSNRIPSDKVVYLYCGKYDKDAGKQTINLNAHSACVNSYTYNPPKLDDAREIGLITTSCTDTNGKEVKVRFAVVVSKIPTATP